MEDPHDIVMALCRIIDRRDAGLRNGTAMAHLEARAQRYRRDARRQGKGVSTRAKVVRESADGNENTRATPQKAA